MMGWASEIDERRFKWSMNIACANKTC